MTNPSEDQNKTINELDTNYIKSQSEIQVNKNEMNYVKRENEILYQKEQTARIIAYSIIGAFLFWELILIIYGFIYHKFDDSILNIINTGKDLFSVPLGVVLGYYFSKKH